MTATVMPAEGQPYKRRSGMPKVMCVDLVEDRMRSRVVAVFVAFAMYLTFGAELIKSTTEHRLEGAGNIILSSTLPSFGYLGPTFHERATAVTVISTLGNAFTQRVCPNLAADICAQNASHVEPVHVNASIVRLDYEIVPTATLNCATEHLASSAGTLDNAMVADACTPVLEAATNTTDDTGTARFPQMAVSSGPPARYTISFGAGEGVTVTAVTRLESQVVDSHSSRSRDFWLGHPMVPSFPPHGPL